MAIAIEHVSTIRYICNIHMHDCGDSYYMHTD